MAELGQTMDPTALVPGSLGDVDAIAALCAKRAEPAGQAAKTVGRAGEVDDWSGNAADAYAARVGVVARRWEATQSALVSVSGAMEDYSWALSAAQSRAADAIGVGVRGIPCGHKIFRGRHSHGCPVVVA